MKYVFLIVLLLLLVTGCNGNEHYERSEIFMNTVITLKADGKNAEQAINESLKKIAELEQIINDDIRQMEDSAGSNDFIKISPEVYSMLKNAQKYYILTDGAFDITIGAAVDLWDFGSDMPRVPTTEEINVVKQLVGFNHLHLHDSDFSVNIDLSGIKINLGGIAKGYGVDVVRKIFIQNEISNGLIDFGTSTIYAFGTKKIGLKNPHNVNELIDIIEITNSAISTSGNYMKFFIVDGKRYHHIINPKTCMPVDNGIAAVSVIVEGDDCAMTADILSTAIFVMGKEQTDKLFPQVKYIIFNN